jgi:dTDP-4-amino-4,6-dideoxygalactose transaminase
MPERIYLSPPHMTGEELKFIQEAFADNWVAPAGPHLTAFESEFAERVGVQHALALSSGTAAIHLGLQLLGVEKDDEVIVSDLTFVGSINPIRYLGAVPIFIDSDAESWNMHPGLLEEFLQKRAKYNRLPKALVVVQLYGQCADMDAILNICQHYNITVLEDAAEALGATYKGKAAGTLGSIGVYSFNGNKIITTSGGGMLVSNNEKLVNQARYLSTQAREPVVHYEHKAIGYNYRMSNILAGIGRGQLSVLAQRVEQKRRIFQYYHDRLGILAGIRFMPEAIWGQHTRWLTVMTVNATSFGVDYETIRLALERENIESRPVWKPMHLQPVYRGCEFIGNGLSEALFNTGLCLPSGTALEPSDLERIIEIISALHVAK